MADLKANIKLMEEPMAEQKIEVENLWKVVNHMTNYIMSYRNAQGSLKDLKTRMKNIKDEKEELDIRYKKVEQQKNDMYKKFEIAIAQLQGRSEYRNEILEQKLNVF